MGADGLDLDTGHCKRCAGFRRSQKIKEPSHCLNLARPGQHSRLILKRHLHFIRPQAHIGDAPVTIDIDLGGNAEGNLTFSRAGDQMVIDHVPHVIALDAAGEGFGQTYFLKFPVEMSAAGSFC